MQKTAVLAAAFLLLGGALGWILLGGGDASDAAAGTGDATVDAPALPGAPAELRAAGGPSTAAVVAAAEAGTGDSRRIVSSVAEEETEDDEPTGPLYRGRVVDEGGRGVGGAEVKLSALEAGRMQGVIGVLGNIITPSKSAVTDDMGRYEIESPGGSTVDITVGADGFAPFEKDDVEIPDDTSIAFDDLILERGVVLYGTVSDDLGVPIAGAELHLVDPDQGFNFNFGPGGDDADGVTDDEGQFEFARLDQGRWAIRVEAEGHPTRLFRGTAATVGRISAPLILEVPRGANIAGVVVGVPADKLESLRVRAIPEGGNEFASMAAGGAPQVELGEGGTFQVGGLDPEKEYELEVLEKGRGAFAMMGSGASRSESVAALPGDDGIELVYRQPATVRFKVLDGATDLPLEKFTARLGMAFNQRRLTDSEGEEITFHKNGEAIFEDLFPSDFEFFGSGESAVRLQVEAEGYAMARQEIEGLEEGAAIDLGTILIQPAPPIRILVTDIEDGDPLRNARIRLEPQPSDDGDGGMQWMERIDLASQVKKAKTDSDGRAEIASIPDVACTLKVDRSGYAPHFIRDLIVGSTAMEFEVELGKGGEVEVFVIDRSGARQPGVIVERRELGEGEGDSSGSRNTSKRNGARFRNLAPGEHAFRISNGRNEDRNNWRRARNGDDDDGWETVQVSHGSELELTLEVRAASTLAGRVRQAGRPLANASVRMDRLDEDDDLERRMERAAVGEGWWGSEQADTDSDGDYRIEGLEEGTYVVAVSHESRSLPWVTSIEVGAGEIEASFDLPLCAVEGRVVDAEGRGVAGVKVRVLPAGRRFEAPDDDGNGGGRFMRSGGLEVVDLGAVGGGGPVATDEVGTTDDSGNFRLEGLTAGVSLVARVDGQFIAPAVSPEFTLEEDEVKSGLRLEVVRGGEIVVVPVATTEDESGFRWINVRAEPEGWGSEAATVEAVAETAEAGDPEAAAEPSSSLVVRPVTSFSFGGGNVTLSGLAPGRWTVSATDGNFRGSDDDQSEGSVVVEVRAGETVTAEVVLE